MQFLASSRPLSPESLTVLALRTTERYATENRQVVCRWVLARAVGSFGVASASLVDALKECVFASLAALYQVSRKAIGQKRVHPWNLPLELRAAIAEGPVAHLWKAVTHVVIIVSALGLGMLSPSKLLFPTIAQIGSGYHSKRTLLKRIACIGLGSIGVALSFQMTVNSRIHKIFEITGLAPYFSNTTPLITGIFTNHVAKIILLGGLICGLYQLKRGYRPQRAADEASKGPELIPEPKAPLATPLIPPRTETTDSMALNTPSPDLAPTSLSTVSDVPKLAPRAPFQLNTDLGAMTPLWFDNLTYGLKISINYEEEGEPRQVAGAITGLDISGNERFLGPSELAIQNKFGIWVTGDAGGIHIENIERIRNFQILNSPRGLTVEQWQGLSEGEIITCIGDHFVDSGVNGNESYTERLCTVKEKIDYHLELRSEALRIEYKNQWGETWEKIVSRHFVHPSSEGGIAILVQNLVEGREARKQGRT